MGVTHAICRARHGEERQDGKFVIAIYSQRIDCIGIVQAVGEFRLNHPEFTWLFLSCHSVAFSITVAFSNIASHIKYIS